MDWRNLAGSDLARRLKEQLAKKGWSQSDLARACWGSETDKNGNEVARSRDIVSRIVSERGLPRRETLRTIAAALGVKEEDLAPVMVEKWGEQWAGGGAAKTGSVEIVSTTGDRVFIKLHRETNARVALQIIEMLAAADAEDV